MAPEKENESLAQLRSELNAMKTNVEKCQTDVATSAGAVTDTLAAIAKLHPGIVNKEPNPETKGKPLHDYAKTVGDFSSKASDINRSLALAGIAVIWIFKNPEKTAATLSTESGPALSNELFWPLALLIASLILDLIHYVYGATFWKIFYEIRLKRWKDGKLTNPQIMDVEAPDRITIPIIIIFYAKITAMGAAYYFLADFLMEKLISLP
jgi:hypothetical protein